MEVNAKKNAPAEVYRLYREITQALIARGQTISTMESCTGGLVASLLTDTEGSSATLRGAFVTYSNEAKIAQGVPAETIERYGVYSAETAEAMAAACREAYGADFGVGITGTAGNPDPANADSRPGEAYFAIDAGGRVESCHICIDRTAEVQRSGITQNAETQHADIAPDDAMHFVVPCAGRQAYKLAVARAVGEALLSILSSS